MEKDLRLIEIYSNRFREAHGLIGEELGKPEPADLDGLLENLETQWDTLLGLYDTVINGSEVEHLEQRVNAMEDCRALYLTTRRAVEKVTKKLPSSSTSDRSTTETSHSVLATAMAKLTAARIPSFSGETVKWPEFWGIYQLTVHDQKVLPDLEKFIRLKEALTGEAASIIEGLPLTNANYAAAIDLLKLHYGSTDVIIQENYRHLYNLPTVPPGNHLALKQFLIDGEVRIRSLESLGVPYSTYAIPFVSLFVDRLPKNVRTAWYRFATDKGETSDVKDVLAFIRREVTSQERSQSGLTTRKRGSVEEPLNQMESKRGRIMPSAAALAAVSKSGNQRAQDNECCFCRATHSPFKCDLPLQKRLEVVRTEKRCFVCLRKGHLAANCRHPNCKKCNRRHHLSLCRDTAYVLNKISKGNPSSFSSSNDSSVACCSALPQEKEVYLKTATVLLYGTDKTIKITCLIDEGSQRSYATEFVADQLGLQEVGVETISICPFGSRKVKEPSAVRRLLLVVSGITKGSELIKMEVLLRPELCADLSAPKAYAVAELADRPIADERIATSFSRPTRIDLVIGADYCRSTVNYKIIKCRSGLLAVSSKFGWLVFGREKQPGTPVFTALSVTSTTLAPSSEIEKENIDLRKFWDIEHFGIVDPHGGSKEPNPLVGFEELIRRGSNGRYSVPLPWRLDKRELLGSNYRQAEERFRRLMLRLRQNSDLLKAYHDLIMEYLQAGFVSKVESPDQPINGIAFYLPHRPVVRSEAVSTKIRPVFDASARADGGLSLNDCLETGENLNPELLAILLRFRWSRVAWVGDIEKAFLQVEINTEDRDALRFLWIDELSTTDYKPVIFRWNRVTFGLSPSPFLLRIVIRKHLSTSKDMDPSLARYIEERLYMDDLLAGSDSTDEATKIIERVIKAFNGACMKLTKWVTNDPAVANTLSRAEKTSFDNELPRPVGCEENSKVLGVIWRPSEDYWTFEATKIAELVADIPVQTTKRQMLSISARLFDPLGLSSPVLLLIKLQFQRLWESGVRWDSPIPENIHQDWMAVVTGLTALAQLRVPRWYFREFNPSSKMELHAFCDASEKAYGAVVYSRSKFKDVFYTNLVVSKTRVAPTKKISLPRLELMGALLVSRLVNYVIKALSLPVTVQNFWCDSTITLGWIKGNINRWKPFVRNRVEEIRKYTQPDQWQYCPGEENPADLASRGCSASELLACKKWFEGPEWLRKPAGKWPNELPPQLTESAKQSISNEQKKGIIAATTSVSVKTELFSLQKYSSFQRVIRITAWIFRYLRNKKIGKKAIRGPVVNNAKETIRVEKNKVVQLECLTAQELEKAELFWIRCAQMSAYPDDFNALRRGKEISKSSPVRILRPLFDHANGVMRVTSRLADRYEFEEQAPPILLPVVDNLPADRIVRLLIWKIHVECLHGGVSLLLDKLRQVYWLIKGRQQVKKIIGSCGRCRRFHARPFAQPMGNLPIERTIESTPFLTTGVDFMGPVYVRPFRTDIETTKVYVCLFVCAVTRAVQLELVSSLSTDTFLLALERLIASRQEVRMLMSDNGTNFAKTARLLNNLSSCPRLAAFLANKRMEWRFIPTEAPWWGGYWERLVRIIKDTLRKSLGFQCLTFEEMLTQVKSTEAMVNSRPLARDTDSPTDLPVCISPNDLIIGRRSSALPATGKSSDFSAVEGAELLTKRLRHQKLIFDRGWRCWTSCYLKDLNNFAQRDRSGFPYPIRIGQIVMIRDDNLPRLHWKVGVVTHLHPGRDGRIRSVTLRRSTGRCSEYAIQSLYPLETEASRVIPETDDASRQPQVHLELSTEGNSRGECKNNSTPRTKKGPGLKLDADLTSNEESQKGRVDCDFNATRTLRSGRQYVVRPRL